MAGVSDPQELWKRVMKWSLAAFLVTVALIVVVGLVMTF